MILGQLQTVKWHLVAGCLKTVFGIWEYGINVRVFLRLQEIVLRPTSGHEM